MLRNEEKPATCHPGPSGPIDHPTAVARPRQKRRLHHQRLARQPSESPIAPASEKDGQTVRSTTTPDKAKQERLREIGVKSDASKQERGPCNLVQSSDKTRHPVDRVKDCEQFCTAMDRAVGHRAALRSAQAQSFDVGIEVFLHMHRRADTSQCLGKLILDFCLADGTRNERAIVFRQQVFDIPAAKVSDLIQ